MGDGGRAGARKEGGREKRGSQPASEDPDLSSILYSVVGNPRRRFKRRAVLQHDRLRLTFDVSVDFCEG
jgi:hypothetical protein